jgi:hypothetical protein
MPTPTPPRPTCGRCRPHWERGPWRPSGRAGPLDYLAADLDPGYEGLEGGQRHRAARHLLTPPRERLIEFGRVDTVQPDQLPGDDDGVAGEDLGGAGEALGASTERQDSNEAPEHLATVRCEINAQPPYAARSARSIGGSRLPLGVLTSAPARLPAPTAAELRRTLQARGVRGHLRW